ncbi:MAG TPA: response regulator [Desulfobacteria bacterium]|nr:response regulator [Desulfobacteria bacterium]
MPHDLLDGKRILVVDDEHDVFETIEELLPMCRLVEANNFEQAKDLLEGEPFDMALLDIMGVRGYDLLKIASAKGIPSVMMTAYALSVKDTVNSFRGGAASYVPKEELAHIAKFLNDILATHKDGKTKGKRWLDRLGDFYDGKFGRDWQSGDEEFWKKFKHWV